MGVDGAYIQSFTAIGYRNLSAEQWVELKALNVTADFARRRRGPSGLLAPDRLVELKALGFARDAQ